MEEQIIKLVQQRTGIPLRSVSKTIALLKDGATIPFIARYRKEVTGSLDEIGVEAIKTSYDGLLELIKRRNTILKSIADQGALTPELKRKVESCWDKVSLEDLYLPYKKKVKTYATIARNNGLEPLAKIILAQRTKNLNADASRFKSKQVSSAEDALQGARHIIAEWVSEDSKNRDTVRRTFDIGATITSKVIASKKSLATKYEQYFDYQEPLKRCPSHRLLAMYRGEKEGFLRVKLKIDDDYAYSRIIQSLSRGRHPDCQSQIKMATTDALSRLIIPSIENEKRKEAKVKADAEAITVFEKNLKDLLMSAPLGEKRIIGIDPGFRTGCKVVVIEKTGELLHNTTIYPHPPVSKQEEASHTIRHLVDKYDVAAIAIGNGTAGKETYSILDKQTYDRKPELYFVNESGASIYSASKIAREEFPDLDLTVRGAVSIARRLMDPLAELVKIDPKSIGVGQYQHDVNQKILKSRLDSTIAHCVNAIGINVNTASKELLSQVSGLGPTLAENIVQHRQANGSFTTRKQLQDVARMGKKAYEQCAGFLRVKDGENILDNTGVHPESYKIVTKMASSQKLTIEKMIDSPADLSTLDLNQFTTSTAGLPTLQDIVKELQRPGLDPRGKAKAVQFSSQINTIDDLSIGMILPGIVNNITKFGAFVDIGVKESGLVHISQIVDRFITDPSEILSVHQEVTVKVMSIDAAKKRIGLSIKEV